MAVTPVNLFNSAADEVTRVPANLRPPSTKSWEAISINWSPPVVPSVISPFTVNPVRVPTLVIKPWAAVPTVPSSLPTTSVPAVKSPTVVLAPVALVDVPIVNLFSDSSQHIKTLGSNPLSIIIPESAVGLPVVPLANSSNLSATRVLVLLTVVVVPETVMLPVTTTLPVPWGASVIAPSGPSVIVIEPVVELPVFNTKS